MQEMTEQYRPKGSIIMAMIWMAVISLLLFWLPLIGPLLAGFVGGRTAGSAGRGLLAALLPALVLCLTLLAYGTALTGLPMLGAIASVSLFLVLVLQGLPLLLAALIGGLTV
jgi:hypothetical protein